MEIVMMMIMKEEEKNYLRNANLEAVMLIKAAFSNGIDIQT